MILSTCSRFSSFSSTPSVFTKFSFASKALILVGIAAQAGLAVIFILLLRRASILRFIGNKLLSLLARLRLIRRAEHKKERLNNAIDSYEKCVELVGKRRGMLARALLYNVLQRGMLIAVTVFVFLAANGAPALSLDVWSAECMVVLGSNYVPIPGAMGVADGLMLDVFGELLGDSVMATNLELLSRSVSFYLCVILCGFSFLLACTRRSIRAKRHKKHGDALEKENTAASKED